MSSHRKVKKLKKKIKKLKAKHAATLSKLQKRAACQAPVEITLTLRFEPNPNAACELTERPPQSFNSEPELSESQAVKNRTQLGKKALKAICRYPLKTPPCKRCPALAGGCCKCACKKFKLPL